MVNAFRLTCILALACLPTLGAKDLADYKIGDTAAEEITTPIALDVIDPAATAARRVEEAQNTPAIFRSYPAVTNEVATAFLSEFAVTRSNFFARFTDAAKLLALNGKSDATPDLAKLMADFNRTNKTFPVTPGLGQLWARGDTGLTVGNVWAERLREAYRRPIRPDSLPAGFILGETLRLVPVKSQQDVLTLDDVTRHGKMATTTRLTTLTQARNLFAADFSGDEQPAGRALAVRLKPDCALDENLTQQARARQTAQIVVAVHFDAGQIVVRQGGLIDAKIKNAFDQISRQVIADNARAQLRHEHELAITAQNQELKTYTRNEWLLAAVVILTVVTLLSFWRLNVERRRAMPDAVRIVQPAPAPLPDIAPHVAEVVKAALLEDLTALREELLKVQQSAATAPAESAAQPDPQELLRERLRDYELRILKLETLQGARSAVVQAAPTAAPGHKNGETLPPRDVQKCVSDLLANGQSLLNVNETENALKCFDLALTLHPDHGETLIKKGGALEKAGRLDEAIACYDRAIAVDGSRTVAYLHKGGLFNRLARYEEAMQCYEQALHTHGKTAA
jgi:tetratricopeptide (TPR) repeat protein